MHSTIFTSLTALCFSGALAIGVALAEPKAPTQEENADADFAKSFVGKSYTGDLEVEDWLDYGGGLVSPPIWIRQYQRGDGTNLILTPATYEVTDAIIVPPPRKGLELVISCTQGDDPTLRFMGEAKGPDDQEWWGDVRRAWEISLETGAITSTKAKGSGPASSSRSSACLA